MCNKSLSNNSMNNEGMNNIHSYIHNLLILGIPPLCFNDSCYTTGNRGIMTLSDSGISFQISSNASASACFTVSTDPRLLIKSGYLPLHICPYICWSIGSCWASVAASAARRVSSSAREILNWADMIGGKAICKQFGMITVWEHEVTV